MKIEDVFYKLRPIWGRRLDLLWQEYLVADPPLRKTIEKVLRVQLARELGETFESEQVLLKPPPQELAHGEYPIGSIHYGPNRYYEFGLREHEFIQHIGIFGRSGSGKTNLAYLVLKGLAQAGKPFLVFDWKRNYRDLLVKEEFAGTVVLTVGRDIVPFRFNPLIPPPGTAATVWLKKLIEVMCHAYFLGEGVSVLLLRAIDALYRQCGLYEGEPRACPTIADVRDWLSAYGPKGRERGWMESAVRAVETLCFGEVGSVLNEPPFFDIPRLLDRQVILELDALVNADKTFLIESLLLWIHHYRLAQEQRETFKHAVVIEEAHHILLRKKQEATGEETVTDVLLREIRELGESIMCLDQHPSLISKPALGNTYATFAMNLKHRGDIAMIQDSLLLDAEQASYLGRLEVGWAIVRLQGRWFWPFLVKVPHVDIDKGAVTDARLKAIAAGGGNDLSLLLDGSKSVSGVISTKDSSSRPKTPSSDAVPSIPASDKGKGESKPTKSGKVCTIGLTTNEYRLLGDIWQNATLGTVERYKRLGLSISMGNRLQHSLYFKGLISSLFICLPRGRKKVFVLTEKGQKMIGISTGLSQRHGGLEHQYWVKALAEHLAAEGHEVTIEAPIGEGKTVDIVASRDGKRIAYEVETGASDVQANIRKCQETGFDEIVVAFTSAQARDRLPGNLTDSNSVRLVTVSELLQQLPRT
jgi:hypothetical protein